MATNTTNYGFKKPDESDFYDVADQNKNWDLADEALKNLDTPTFEDYTGSTAVPSATDAIDQIKSKGKLGTLLSNIKAAFKGACLIGHIVNNCVTDNAGLPLSAAQGKVLKDLYTQLYSDLNTTNNNLSNRWTLYGAEIIPNNADMYTYTEPGNYACATNAVAATLKNCPLSTAFDLKVYRSAGGKTDGYIIQEYTAHDAKQRVLVPYDPYTSGTKWGNPITFATKSETLTFRGIFEGNLNDAASWKIPAGIYQIQGKDTISNGPDGAQWCLFIQFPDDYHNQIICIGGDNGVVTRRYIGSPQVWTSWT